LGCPRWNQRWRGGEIPLINGRFASHNLVSETGDATSRGVAHPALVYGLRVAQVKWNVEHLVRVDSTNTWLARSARNGAHQGEVVYADFQSAGRGRLDREWVAPAGSSLLCSALLEPPAIGAPPQMLVLAAALSMCEALEGLTGARPRLKWPNDIMYGEAKVAGLLAEAVGPQVVVGLGLNLSAVDPVYSAATTVLEATGVSLSPTAVLEAYLEALARRRELLDSPEGVRTMIEEFVASLSTLGRWVRAELSNEVVRGRAIGVDEDGALRIDTGSDVRVVSAGDVVHLRGEEQP
jgi:BirA family biotin operon repressor/biotin-[acetyl-CoA-carboxylase] ligase